MTDDLLHRARCRAMKLRHELYDTMSAQLIEELCALVTKLAADNVRQVFSAQEFVAAESNVKRLAELYDKNKP